MSNDVSDINNSIKEEEGVTCPICFGEYTSSGDHRIASMKCGHLFGHSCILEWFGKRKHVLCPVCSSKCLKSQIRLIFSSKVVALNTEKEHKLIEQYLTEFNAKNKLLEEISALKTELEILKLNTKQICDCKINKKENSQNFLFYKKILVNFNTKNSLILIDEVNNLIVLSTIKDNKPCIVKYYESGMTSIKFFNDTGIITHMKYIDGNVVLSIKDKFYIVNIYNSNIIFEDTNYKKITCLLTNQKNRNKLIIGDVQGNITFYILGHNKKTVKICNIPIHSLYECKGYVYIGTVFNIYKLKIDDNWEMFLLHDDIPEICKLNLDIEDMNCINIFGEEDSVVLVYRNRFNKILHYHINETEEKAINMGLKQIIKYREMMCNKMYYLVDQSENKIVVTNEKYEKEIEYKVEENMICFDVKTELLVILTEKFIYLYK
ncbi:E3 ubiquitin-protein ligase RFWD3 [Vairimorpha necatrix]|uniref:E3 ubiquitin-protein ligase RFWD3 n=1 Tax=Vairimorpha necatrix TaxID=6039 RepID=A0AAX4JBK1_9MICR